MASVWEDNLSLEAHSCCVQLTTILIPIQLSFNA